MAIPNKQSALDSYVTVAERIASFYQAYPDGRICTAIVEHNLESGFILMRAEVYRGPDDAQPAATGHAFEVRGESYVNKTSYIENAETSSVGRALALLGFEVKRGIASREEVEKTVQAQTESQAHAPTQPRPDASTRQPSSGRSATAQPSSAARAEQPEDLDRSILESAQRLGYDEAKVRKWVNQKFKVTDGLNGLGPQEKREVLRIFREKAAG